MGEGREGRGGEKKKKGGERKGKGRESDPLVRLR